MSPRLVGPRPVGARLGPRLGGVALLLLFFQSACATGGPWSNLLAGHRYESLAPPPAPRAYVTLAPGSDFAPVQLSDTEFREALAQLVVSVPLRVTTRPAWPMAGRLMLASWPSSGPGDRLQAQQARHPDGVRQENGMAKRYFELNDDMSRPDRWLLGDPLDEQEKEVRALQFMSGEPARFDGRLRVPVYHPGTSLDFTRVDTGGFPVVSEKVARVLAELAPGDVQLFPVEVESRPEPYFLVNVARRVKCIDEAASEEVLYEDPEDNWPDELGYYQAVYGMRIDPSKVGDAKVFRPWGYTGSLLVAEDVKDALERTGATGLKFKDVTGPSPITDEERVRDRKIRELLETAASAREAAWRTIGSLDGEVIMPIAMSGSWPGQRQLWSGIRREAGLTLLVTHGLSDPFIEHLEPSVGFGLELALEVDAAVKDISKGWPLMLLDRVASEIAEHEHVRRRVKAGLFSMEVSGEGLPRSLVTGEGRVAVLLGMESRTLPGHISTPYGTVKLVTVKALLPSELAYLLEHGAQGTAELARRFVESGEEHLSRAMRPAVV